MLPPRTHDHTEPDQEGVRPLFRPRSVPAIMPLTPQTLQRGLLELGFTPITELTHAYTDGGGVQARLLDGARLCLNSPRLGLRYIAVISLLHLAQEIAAFRGH